MIPSNLRHCFRTPRTYKTGRMRERDRWAMFSWVAIALSGCGQSNQAARTNVAGDKASVPEVGADNSDLDVSGELPVLARSLIHSIHSNPSFIISGNQVSFAYGRPLDAERLAQPPYTSDADAVAAARLWINANFGEPPAGVSLRASTVHFTAPVSGGAGRAPSPGNAEDCSIVFQERYRGICTDGYVVVHLARRTVFSASVSLFSYDVVPASAKVVVRKSTATDAWWSRFQQLPDAQKIIREFPRFGDPKLEYVWSPLANQGHDKNNLVAPTWVLDEEGKMMVDGHTGAVWFND
jgi:hypothetical protein